MLLPLGLQSAATLATLSLWKQLLSNNKYVFAKDFYEVKEYISKIMASLKCAVLSNLLNQMAQKPQKKCRHGVVPETCLWIEHYVCTSPAQEVNKAGLEKYIFCLITKHMHFVQISGVGFKFVLQWKHVLVSCFRKTKKREREKLLSYFLFIETHKPAFSIQFRGSNDVTADIITFSWKYINDCQVMSYCSFKVPINSNCQGIVYFYNVLFDLVFST